ncbi:MAG: winged helix-turn-helix transcriptional regulator [Candidatus Thermoplasmatota archaeon]|jgi:DNA-binding Lrp family transcriptional regulator|nr:winged helix-turn-helix transcriptional regulator [Candidatus Thermoplasmatota archaeon]
MDVTDKRILFSILKDGRIAQRKIAMDVGISAQALNYRLSRLIEDGIIRGFTLHVSPRINGYLEAFAAFRTEKDYDGDVISRIKCLEEISLYGFSGKDQADIDRKLGNAVSKLGSPVMQYVPAMAPLGMNINSTDLEIINILKTDPRMSVTDISSQLDIPYMTVKRRLNLLMKNHIIGVITELDLSGGDIVLYSIFSTSVDRAREILAPQTIFSISDSRAGVYTCFSESLSNARGSISRIREVDSSANVMILYDYKFYS